MPLNTVHDLGHAGNYSVLEMLMNKNIAIYQWYIFTPGIC